MRGHHDQTRKGGFVLQEYNDYVTATREYLRRYHEFEATVANLREEVAAQEALLKIETAAPIAKYGVEPGGGSSELNAVEAAAARKIAIEKKIEKLTREADNIERVLRKIDRALDALPTQERQLIKGYYIDKKSWRELSIELYITEKWASSCGNKGVKRLARMIFGNEAISWQDSLFVFLNR